MRIRMTAILEPMIVVASVVAGLEPIVVVFIASPIMVYIIMCKCIGSSGHHLLACSFVIDCVPILFSAAVIDCSISNGFVLIVHFLELLVVVVVELLCQSSSIL